MRHHKQSSQSIKTAVRRHAQSKSIEASGLSPNIFKTIRYTSWPLNHQRQWWINARHSRIGNMDRSTLFMVHSWSHCVLNISSCWPCLADDQFSIIWTLPPTHHHTIREYFQLNKEHGTVKLRDINLEPNSEGSLLTRAVHVRNSVTSDVWVSRSLRNKWMLSAISNYSAN